LMIDSRSGRRMMDSFGAGRIGLVDYLRSCAST
jgi:hypothetical protein